MAKGKPSGAAELEQLRESLKSRVRELDCLYSIADLVSKASTVAEVFETAVAFLPQGYRDPESLRARVLFQGRRFQSDGFPPEGRVQSAELTAGGKPAGAVEVCRAPGADGQGFSREEQAMLMAVAERLGQAVDLLLAQKEVRFKNALMAAQHEATLDGIVTLDAAGQALSFNKRFLDIWGVDAAALQAPGPEPMRQALRDKLVDAGSFDATVRRLRAQPRELGRGEIALADGRTLDFYTAPVLGSADQCYGRIWHFRDITELRRAQQAQKDAVAMATHELRTPLAVISNALYLIQEGTRPQECLAMAAANCERMRRLIDNYLDLARIESGRMEFRFAPVSLPALVERALSDNAACAGPDGASFALGESLPEAWVRADCERLTQVLANLLSNAAKFSPAGGRVEVSLARRGGRLRVAVSDQGPGVAPEFRAKVFEKFASRAAAHNKKGTGLGLSISKAIVQAHGGEMGFSDNPSGGATFFFELPESRPAGA
ncbi:MAG: ATP-binding protein [Elusimicrobia bacterium]|nr:ATP-binding protein [Elusimicrobiota bacterium]